MTFAGVEVTGSAFRAAMYNTIGGPEIADQNIIGGNGVGVSFFPMAAGNNFVEGNMIGTDLRGRLPRGNVFEAVSIQSATNIHITRNLLAASTGAGGCGIRMIGSAGNSIMNNEIGNGLGSTDLGNSGDGVAAQGSSQVTIDDNYIDFNRGYGINMIGCDNWIIRKNRIGVAASGGETFGNLEGGIYLQDCSTNLLEENGIAMNGGPGISIRSGIANRITENFSLDNMGLGIDLGADGDTENDPGDTDLGANNLQNFPVLTEAMGGNGALTVSGHLASLPSQTYRIEIFLTSPWFPWDESEGQVPIGWTNVITDAAGEVSFTFQYPLEPWIKAGTRVTATTTDPMGNTSEFSPSILLVSKADPPTLGVLAAGGTLTFCWPADSSGFSLEVADSLTTPPADWHRVMSEIVVRDGRQCFTVTNSAAKPQQFFRLCK
jgi:parallel beta-helix repeat protein